MADVSSIKPYGAGGASLNFKDATARSNISGLDTRVTALENAGGGVKIYRIAGPEIITDDIHNSVSGVVKWDSENRVWFNDYDDTGFIYVPVTSLMPKYPSTTPPSVNVGDILIGYEDEYGSIKTVVAIMNSTTVPSIIRDCVNGNPDRTAAQKTAFYNSLASVYNEYGTLLITGAGTMGVGIFGYFTS